MVVSKPATKRKYLYLYLALACFLGIIIIFVVDGYMGIYDTLTVNSNDISQVIQADQWQEQEKYDYLPSVGVSYGSNMTCVYELDNRWPAAYRDDVTVTVRYNQADIDQLLKESVIVKGFSSTKLNWIFSPSKYISSIPSGTTAQFTVVIKRGYIERLVIIYVTAGIDGGKFIPLPGVN